MESLEVVQQTSAVILAAIKMEKPVLPEAPEAEEPQSATGMSTESEGVNIPASPIPAESNEAVQPAA